MLGTSLLWRSTVAFTYLNVKSAKCLCLLPVVLVFVLRIWSCLHRRLWQPELPRTDEDFLCFRLIFCIGYTLLFIVNCTLCDTAAPFTAICGCDFPVVCINVLLLAAAAAAADISTSCSNSITVKARKFTPPLLQFRPIATQWAYMVNMGQPCRAPPVVNYHLDHW